MPVRRCLLEGEEIRSIGDLYDQLASGLGFPPHFGRNLDALRDTLSADVEGPFEIVWKRADASKRLMGPSFGKVVKLLRSLEDERDDFTFTLA